MSSINLCSPTAPAATLSSTYCPPWTWSKGCRREEESGEGVGGEAEKGGPGLQNGPPQPGPGQGGQGLCALKCAITSRQTAQCSFYIYVQFHFQNKWDPVKIYRE